MNKRVLAGLLAVTITALAGLTGCGGKNPSSGAGEESDDVEGGSGKVWEIATDTSFKPFEYTDANGDFVGIDMDILAAVAQDQGFKYKVQVLGWDASIAACQAGQVDGMIAGASITEERKGSGWIFSDGYYDANQCMAVAKDSDITGFDGLRGGSVAVKTGTMSASYAQDLSKEYGFTVTYFEDSPTMYSAVTGGQVTACFDDTPIMAANIKDGDLAMKLVDGTGNEPTEYGFAIFNADNQELIDMFNAGLKNIRANGIYDEIIVRYIGR